MAVLLAALVADAAAAEASIPRAETWPSLLEETAASRLQPPTLEELAAELAPSAPAAAVASADRPFRLFEGLHLVARAPAAEASRFRLFGDVAGELAVFDLVPWPAAGERFRLFEGLRPAGQGTASRLSGLRLLAGVAGDLGALGRLPRRLHLLPQLETRLGGSSFLGWAQRQGNTGFSLGIVVGEGVSPNLYAFVGWQPSMLTDPTGECPQCVYYELEEAVETFNRAGEAYVFQPGARLGGWGVGVVKRVGTTVWDLTPLGMAATSISQSVEESKLYLAAYRIGGFQGVLALSERLGEQRREELPGQLLGLVPGVPTYRAGKEAAEVCSEDRGFRCGVAVGEATAQGGIDATVVYGSVRYLQARFSARSVNLLRAAAGEITPEGIARIEQHLARPELNALNDPPNAAMIARLRAGYRTTHDLQFYLHELVEAELMEAGVGARAAHMRTLETQRIPYRPGYEAELYHPDVIRKFPDFFNPAAHPKPTSEP